MARAASLIFVRLYWQLQDSKRAEIRHANCVLHTRVSIAGMFADQLQLYSFFLDYTRYKISGDDMRCTGRIKKPYHDW